MPNLLDYVNDYLIAQNIVRDPTVAGSLPPLWVKPRNGVPAPGEALKDPVETGPDIVVGAFKAPGISTGRHNGFQRIEAVDFLIRTRKGYMADDFYPSLKAALNDKRGWSMAGLYVAESLEYRELAPLGTPESGGWVDTAQFTFQTFTQ